MSSERHPVEQLAEDFLARYRRGERPPLSAYVDQYPEVAEELAEIIQALLLLEEVGGSNGAGGMPARLGEYRLLREIGRGGMGRVFEAEQETLGRRVAVKVLPTLGLLRPDQAERFRREARAAASLHHTNIVPVFGVGTQDGVHYYAMQHIAGRDLGAILTELRRTPAENSTAVSVRTPLSGDGTAAHFHAAATIAVQIADALEHAHARGVLHRDVKPGNIMLDAHGTAWLGDFGLAQADGNATLTGTGELVGTLHYLAPERLHGTGDARADIFALGATLYEMLTLHPARPAQERVELLRQIAEEEPPPPRHIQPAVPRDLETIVLKALARQPADRYDRAGAMADDLRRFLADRPVLARRPRLHERLWRWLRRHPAWASVWLALLLAVSALVGGTLYHNRQLSSALLTVDQERDRAERRAADALEAVDRLLTRAAMTDLRDTPGMEPARRRLLQDALEFYQRFLRETPTDPARRAQVAHAYRRCGQLHERLGDHAAALQAYAAAEERLRQLLAEHPDRTADHLELALVCADQAERHAKAGNLALAQTKAQTALQMMKSLPDSPQPLLDPRGGRVTALNILGSGHAREGRFQEAAQVFEQTVRICRELVAEEPAHLLHRDHLCVALINLSLALEDLDRNTEATPLVEEALENARALHTLVPRNSNQRARLATLCDRLGLHRRRAGQRDQARTLHTEAVQLWTALMSDFPHTPNYAHELGGALHNLALVHEADTNWAEAARLTAQAAELQERMLRAIPGHRDAQNYLASHCLVLSRVRLQVGDHAGAAQAAERLARVPRAPHQPWRRTQSAAWLIAAVVPLVDKDHTLSPHDRERLQTKHTDRAMALLQQAVQLGYRDRENLLSDPVWAPLRQRPEFAQLTR